MVAVPTKSQAEALLEELAGSLAREHYPSDLCISNVGTGLILVSSVEQAWVR